MIPSGPYTCESPKSDDFHQAGYGLLKADLSPRPAYTALKTLLLG